MSADELRVLTLAELEKLPIPAVRWLVADLVPAGALVLLVGRPKQGKSLLSLDLAASVALGETFLGRATAQGPTLYVPAEDALTIVRERLWTRFGSDRQAPFCVAPVDGSMEQTLRLDDVDQFGRLAATVIARQLSLLVLDPLRELHRAKENDADEMALLLRPLRQLAHETGCAIVLIHHRNKGSSEPGTSARGSSAITGSVDVIMTMDASGGDDETLTPDQTVRLTIEGRYGPRVVVTTCLRSGLRWLEAAPSVAIDDATTPTRIVRRIGESLAPLTAEQIAAGIAASLKAVQNALPALVRSGRVRRTGSGHRGEPFVYGPPPIIPPDTVPYTPEPGGNSLEPVSLNGHRPQEAHR